MQLRQIRIKAKQETRLVVWGQNIPSNVGSGRFTKQVSNIIKIPSHLQGFICGLILSDASLVFASKAHKMQD